MRLEEDEKLCFYAVHLQLHGRALNLPVVASAVFMDAVGLSVSEAEPQKLACQANRANPRYRRLLNDDF